MNKRKTPGKGESGFDLGLGNILRGLGGLVQRLGEVAEETGEMRREGTLGGVGGEKGFKGVYGFSVKIGGTGGPGAIRVEPFGNIQRDEHGDPTVAEEREPIVDLFDESDHVLVLTELPGVKESQVKTQLQGDVLLITAGEEGRKYRKEILLPQSFEASQLSSSLLNGILEVRLQKTPPQKRT